MDYEERKKLTLVQIVFVLVEPELLVFVRCPLVPPEPEQEGGRYKKAGETCQKKLAKLSVKVVGIFWLKYS